MTAIPAPVAASAAAATTPTHGATTTAITRATTRRPVTRSSPKNNRGGHASDDDGDDDDDYVPNKIGPLDSDAASDDDGDDDDDDYIPNKIVLITKLNNDKQECDQVGTAQCWHKCTRALLRLECKKRNLPSSGRKHELIELLQLNSGPTTSESLRDMAVPLRNTRKRQAKSLTLSTPPASKRQTTLRIPQSVKGMVPKQSSKARLYTDGSKTPKVGYDHHIQWYISPNDPQFSHALKNYHPTIPDVLLTLGTGIRIQTMHYESQRAQRELFQQKLNLTLESIFSLRGWVIRIDKNGRLYTAYQMFKDVAHGIDTQHTGTDENKLHTLCFNYNKVIDNLSEEMTRFQQQHKRTVTSPKTNNNRINFRWKLQQLGATTYTILYPDDTFQDRRVTYLAWSLTNSKKLTMA